MGKLLGLVICATFVLSTASAMELSFFDYDGTIFEPQTFSKNTPNTYADKIVLYKIENRPNLLVETSEGPREIEVSVSDLIHKLTRINEMTEEDESLLSPKDGRIGSLDRVTLSDGMVIVPGLYRIDPLSSYKYFREGLQGQNHLLESFKRAEELDSKGLGTFKGPYWSHMVNMLSHPDSAKQFGIITARGHSKKEWKEYFEYLLERGYINYLPNLDNVHNINRPEYEQYGMNDFDSVRKVNLLKKILQELSRVKLKDADKRLHPDGKSTGQFHSLSFIDDNQKTLELAYEELRNFAMRRWNVKIILSNSGLDHEVKKSKKPKSFVITQDGTVRSATAFETYGEPIHMSDKKFVGAKSLVVKDSSEMGMSQCSMFFN